MSNAKRNAIDEATALYGDLATAERYKNVQRGLKSRHVQFIALGATIGTGLFLGIGSAFATAGPLSVLLGYTITGLAVFAMLQCLCEMATWLPLPGAIPQYCSRYVDPAMGFAVGWNNWYHSCITVCAEIAAAAVVVEFWNNTISIAAWISIIILVVVCLNILVVSVYGEAAFIFASAKIITLVGLLLLALILDLGGGPNKDRIGFRYWKNPGAMKEYIGTGNSGRFLGLFSTLLNAAFSWGGVEIVAVAGGETRNPRKNIPKAVKRVFWRVFFLYVLGSLAIGVLVPSNEKKLLSKAAGAARSPWVIAIYSAGIPALPSIINAVILTSAASSANAYLYTGSRYLFGVAQNGHAPRCLLKCSKAGVPYNCVWITAAGSLLTYMSVSSNANDVFIWFQALTTIAQLFTWCSICVAYLRFRSALIAQGVDRDTLVFKSRFQPYTAWFALIYFAMIILFNGFAVFTKAHWAVQDFITAYIGIPIYFLLYAVWKIWKRPGFVKPAAADIWTGKSTMDEHVWPEQAPRNFLERLWAWIC
ncbi:amino-acid permease inda1 [Lophium mytilinum]|uniref:Amino-acid permease inda1 n=1 Tax=Lophium mytilinum TaxID=390894 RepID=A0A6A6RF02_9PEZI|nr:amino-acid permease inda1 [Lophium mytilinum]